MRKSAVILIMMLFAVSAAYAHEEDTTAKDLEEGKSIVSAGLSCDKLTDEQLEHVGEYLMEQMHPGESHEKMHEMMGINEGLNEEKQFHIYLAKMMYCSSGQGMMMNLMNGGSGMMQMGGKSMMGGMQGMGGMMNGGMMSGSMYGGGYGYWLLNYILAIAIPTLAIILILWFWKRLSKK